MLHQIHKFCAHYNIFIGSIMQTENVLQCYSELVQWSSIFTCFAHLEIWNKGPIQIEQSSVINLQWIAAFNVTN